MNNETRSDDYWTLSGRVVLHGVLAIVFLGLSNFCTSSEFSGLAAYVPPVLVLPCFALVILVISLVLSSTHSVGKNLHLMCSLGMAVSLFLTSLAVWKRDFEHGYAGTINANILFTICGIFVLATATIWLVRRQHGKVSIKQLAGAVVVVALVMTGIQQILRIDKMSSYKDEIGAARELERAGMRLTWNDWSVSGIAIRNAGIRDAQLSRIGEFPNLRSLSLEGNPVSDATLASIANVRNLHGLYLTDTNIGDLGLSYLEDAVHLEQLWLRGTRVTDAGLSSLKGLHSLGYVDLSNTNVTDAGLKKLTHLKHMYYLHLPGTRVTKEGMESLGKVLPNCSIYGTPGGDSYTVERSR
ncbi:MAG: hypothetical protein AAF483_28605 [Planctomycetota bacterium]